MFRHFVFNYKGFVFVTYYKYMYIKYRPTKHFSIIWVLYFYRLPQAIVYLLYFDVLIASNHEFVQSTKEIQVASFYIYCLSFVAVFYRSKSIEHGKGMFFRVWLRKPLIHSLQFCPLKGKQTGSQTPKVIPEATCRSTRLGMDLMQLLVFHYTVYCFCDCSLSSTNS